MSIVWITGLSGAGKSTIGRKVLKKLRKNGEQVVYLDGDELRDVFGAGSISVANHGREGRLALAMQYSHLCRVIAKQELTVVIATISMFKEIHTWNRENLSGYFEVYLKVPVDELRKRDPKKIYKKFDNGELSSVAGLDLDIDEPLCANLIIDFSERKTADESANEIIKYMKQEIR